MNPRYWIKKRSKIRGRDKEIDPDEIFLDASNLPNFDTDQFEGRMERPIPKGALLACLIFFIAIVLVFAGKSWNLEIKNGNFYSEKSKNNNLRRAVLFAERGVIYDRNGALLASNEPSKENPEFSHRNYLSEPGLSHIVGYVKYPSKDSAGFYYKEDFEGVDGSEKIYNNILAGQNGVRIIEIDALRKIQSESVIEPPKNGRNITLSIDKKIQSQLYQFIKNTAKEIGFDGGAAAIMDISNGEILAAVSYPEYDSQTLSDGNDSKTIQGLASDPKKPFLNRPLDGLYTPGSIVKPFIALAALNEKVATPEKKILSTGSISIPNPFDPDKKSVFRDWRAQGWVDMRQALSVSSDVYFYEIGGGFEDQKGLGINAINRYMHLFGFGEDLPNNPLIDRTGVIPSPEWKRENFKGDDWRIGDTYNTAIGQYGFQVTVMQVARAAAAIGNSGRLLDPTLLLNGNSGRTDYFKDTPIPEEYFRVVQEGMRQAVIDGTAKGLNIPQVEIAAKTGTAELGTAKKFVNSWVMGFFPYQHPRFSFAAIMEKGSSKNTIGALYAMRKMFEWMSANTPKYFEQG